MSFRILGVDPGLTRCGLGLVEAGRGRSLRLVDVGVARTRADEDPALRLAHIADELEAWIRRLEPDAVAVERVFAQHNVRTVTGTAQVAGLAMVAATRAGVPVALHTPSEVKAAVTGNGRAEKAQVQEMVRRILDLDERPQPADAADALALAITHAWRSHAVGQVHAGAPGERQTAAQQAWARAEAAARSGGRAAPRLGARPAGRG
ncbi:crossover junction endodeoxyribonuclease RuvC [Occultella glacieicola]|uniref:Crossover junction endodeoxyribonuclease RuvC n=1 Tax=Occultella glacieicola TaxID=2518684 RepID=A0ABY2E1G6_9MICO|nr:crossover junction endodeoxyribonuclease RuvC [Occultella glacieicola]TDE92460.1 crossover junction endodeoxyribonuclease RuvC [Occultella glacieicola]